MIGDGLVSEEIMGGRRTEPRDYPHPVMEGIASVFACDSGSAAIGEDGAYYRWGMGDMGRTTTPSRIFEDVTSVSANYWRAIKSDGTLWARGFAPGDGSGRNDSNPIQVMENAKYVSAGRNHTMVILNDGTLWGWGSNHAGQLGNGETSDETQLTPILIMDNVATVSAGFEFTLAVKTDGSLWGWGSNGNGQLGDGTTTDRHSPVHILDNVMLP